ncbi:homoserine kinase [mine drainage metagenome]|uniref:Homoserine kinase n=1 Tax=mine drainage metagenome TaxID=410659 RepID=A0A1J5Q9T7_9ZZZZ
MSISRPSFRAAPAKIRVPASSANLGPGFDSLGLALDMYDVLAAQVADEKCLEVDIAGEGVEDLRRDGKNLVVKSMNAAFDHMGGRPRGLRLSCANSIPHARGLGSSSAAIIGGMTLARALVLGGQDRLPDEKMLQLASEMEGHPDNVAAALYGGATIAWQSEDGARAVKISPHPDLRAVAFIPNSGVSTSKARRLLPESVPHADAARNAGRAALLVEALEHHPEYLFDATEDSLHQQYRREAMPRSLSLVTKLRASGFAAFVSGAGPTVLVLHTSGIDGGFVDFAGSSFEIVDLAIARTGVEVG